MDRASETSGTCIRCGRPYRSGIDLICDCGLSLEAPAQAAATPIAPPSRRGLSRPVGCLLAVLAVVPVLGGLILMAPPYTMGRQFLSLALYSVGVVWMAMGILSVFGRQGKFTTDGAPQSVLRLQGGKAVGAACLLLAVALGGEFLFVQRNRAMRVEEVLQKNVFFRELRAHDAKLYSSIRARIEDAVRNGRPVSDIAALRTEVSAAIQRHLPTASDEALVAYFTTFVSAWNRWRRRTSMPRTPLRSRTRRRPAAITLLLARPCSKRWQPSSARPGRT